jgi:hypothetical protein
MPARQIRPKLRAEASPPATRANALSGKGFEPNLALVTVD